MRTFVCERIFWYLFFLGVQSTRIFSRVCVCESNILFSQRHSIYNRLYVCIIYKALRCPWLLESAVGIYYLGYVQTRLKSAQAAWHDYSAICAHNLFAVYHIDKLSADNCTSFYNGKMCERTQIFHVKMWCCWLWY